MLVLAESSSDLVRERWSRVAKLGLSRDADAYPVATSDVDLQQRRERLADAFREVGDLLDLVCGQLARGPHVAIVADPSGVILSAQSEPREVHPLTRVQLVSGARWSEDTRGTNAIGTAAAEGRAVAVVGKAHFETRNANLFCYATPVRDAYGEIVAVLDVSGPLASQHPGLGLAVQTAGLVLERALRAVAYGDAHRSALNAIEHLVQRASEPALLVEASGFVRLVNAAAQRELPLPAESPLSCERVFGVPFGELLAVGGSTRFVTAQDSFQLLIDPIFGPGQRALALLVRLERERGSVLARTPVTPPRTQENPAFSAILGDDAGLSASKDLALRLARTELPVLLAGETGTGKELFARAIHAASPRAKRPFVAVNCGALSPSLIASELFGYAPGAFTGAGRNGSDGLIAAADGGTLFLDEIAEMSEALQASLLRVLDDGFYMRVGETRPRKADFRLISASCKNLDDAVKQGKFRSDLLFRVRGAALAIPALRERTDRVWLAQRLLLQLAPDRSPRLSDDARAWLFEHSFPGNVRELKSALGHALALSEDGSVIRRADFPRLPASDHEAAHNGTRKDIVDEAIRVALRECSGNVSETARRLGVGRGTIYRALRQSKR